VIDSIHTLTPKQYVDARRRELRAEYPAAPVDNINACLDDIALLDEWCRAIFAAAAEGEPIKPVVLDRLFGLRPGAFWELLRSHETALPAGYLNPHARKLNKEAS
jgi:hypothetical protein